MNPQVEQILKTPIKSLRLSPEFKERTALHHYDTLAEIMNLPLIELVAMKWFSRDLLEELSEFMYNLRNVKDAAPGDPLRDADD